MAITKITSNVIEDGGIDTVHIADNQVTLAKMAGITRGSIIIGNSSGDPAALSVGSSGQALTSDGTDISWGSVGATLSGSTNNTVVTVTGSNAMTGEANLTFDGSNLEIGNVTNAATLSAAVASAAVCKFDRLTDDGGIVSVQQDNTELGYLGSNGNSFIVKQSVSGGALDLQTHDGNEGILLDASGYIQFEAGGSERIRIISDGKVGIGVTDPDCALEVAGTDAMSVPSGTTAQRPTARNGMVRYNSTLDQMECREDDNWKTFDTTIPPYSASWLVIAGGGGGGTQSAGAGGGGAGGYRSSYNNETSGGGGSAESALSFNSGTQYTITIGAGGAGGSGSGQGGYQGSASSITGSDITDITTVGGGYGGGQSYRGTPGGNGGSGGGSSYGSSGYGSPTANQGYRGTRSVYWGGGPYGGGGGGGAGAAAGEVQSSPNVSGAGGAGRASTITGSSVTYAGGGGGSSIHGGAAGAGGSGGGGTGATRNTDDNGGSGTANTGSGGGGGDNNSTTSNGGAGGSGVVIIRVPTGNYTGTTTGSPTVTTDGSDTIMKFTASGTYTA